MSTQSNPRLHQEKEQHIVEPLGDADKLRIISPLKQFLLSCFGPMGKAKYIKNRHGALMALTASSPRLLGNLTLVSPISQIIASSIQQHLSAYSDGGLYMGVLMLSLIEGALRDQIHHMICCEVNTTLMHRYLEAMEDAVIKVNLSDMEVMLCLVRNVFQSKASCCLTSPGIKVLSSLVLQILTSAIPESDSGKMTIPSVEYRVIPGRPVSDAELVNGVLLDVPKSLSRSVSSWKGKIDKTPLKVALFNTSLEVDKVLIEGVTFEAGCDVDLEEYASQQMRQLASRLRELGVNVVACQKVIHPTLVKILSGCKILCLERLSIVHIASVQKLTGACLLSSMNDDIPADSLGCLKGVTWYEDLDQRWLHLTNESRVTTIILCHRNGTCLEELKHLFGVAYHVACLALSNPDVVPGGGYCEALMASRIREELTEISEEACLRLQCSSLQFSRAADVFLRALEGIAESLGYTPAVSQSIKSISEESDAPVTGSSHQSSPGRCPRVSGIQDGGKTKVQRTQNGSEQSAITDWDKEVVDLVLVKKNAFKMAVEMANMILSIGCVVGSPDS